MTRKLIIVLLIILILTIILQVNNTELVEYSGADVDDIYTSDDFNRLWKSNNLEDIKTFLDTEGNSILQEYMELPYNDMIIKHDKYKKRLVDHYLDKEQESINNMLTGNPRMRLVHFKKSFKSPPTDSDNYNRAGEIIRKIDGKVYVWQPLSLEMLSNGEGMLHNLIKADANKPYIECWILEAMRSGNLNSVLSDTIKTKYKSSRPNENQILSYEKTYPTFTFDKDKLRIGSQVIKYIGPRKDNKSRVLDGYLKRSDTGMAAYNAIGNNVNYDNYWDDNNKIKAEYKSYQKFVEDTVTHLPGNVLCFGLQWKKGEVFYETSDTKCTSVENQGNHSHGWPHGWAFNFYKIEKAKIDDSIYTENANELEVDHDEAQKRRLTIKRDNNTVLILKRDL